VGTNQTQIDSDTHWSYVKLVDEVLHQSVVDYILHTNNGCVTEFKVCPAGSCGSPHNMLTCTLRSYAKTDMAGWGTAQAQQQEDWSKAKEADYSAKLRDVCLNTPVPDLTQTKSLALELALLYKMIKSCLPPDQGTSRKRGREGPQPSEDQRGLDKMSKHQQFLIEKLALHLEARASRPLGTYKTSEALQHIKDTEKVKWLLGLVRSKDSGTTKSTDSLKANYVHKHISTHPNMSTI
jgi:hypothetical protein